MVTRRSLEPGNFFISKWKLHLSVVLATLCFSSLSSGSQCTPGNETEPLELIPNVTEITLEEGKDLKVICLTTGHGTRDISYIKWYKRNSTGRYNLTKPMVVRRSSCRVDREDLIINSASYGVQGSYICERKAPDGSVTSAKFNITFKDDKAPTIIVKPSSQKVTEMKDAINLTCSSIKGSPLQKLIWFHGYKDLENCSNKISCSLILKKPQYPYHNGKYACLAVHASGRESEVANVQVLVPPTISKTDTHAGEIMTIANSSWNARLKCIVTRAHPSPTFKWFLLVGNQWRENFTKISVTPQTSKPTKASTLVVPPPLSKQAVFSCRASNEAGYDEKSISVNWQESSSHSKTPSQVLVLAIVISCSVVLILLVLIVAYFYKRKMLEKYGPYLQTNLLFEFDSNLTVHEQSHKMPYDPKWEFPRENLFMIEPIGKGAFGEVWFAKAKGILEFKAKASSMSATRKKRFSRMFSFRSEYSNIEVVNETELSKVAVKTLKG